jgi:hypothetical protein
LPSINARGATSNRNKKHEFFGDYGEHPPKKEPLNKQAGIRE